MNAAPTRFLRAMLLLVGLLLPAVHAAPAAAEGKTKTDWRRDPTVKRRPSSYLGGSLNYLQLWTWLDATDDHQRLAFGPLHSAANLFRVGDALNEHFCLGFQVQILSARREKTQLSAFAILLDATVYPWKGLGIRPSAGFGFGFAQGKNQWEFGFGGPGTLAMAFLYEFRVTRHLTLAPIIQGTWMAAEGYNGLFVMAGVEVTAWFSDRSKRPATPSGK